MSTTSLPFKSQCDILNNSESVEVGVTFPPCTKSAFKILHRFFLQFPNNISNCGSNICQREIFTLFLDEYIHLHKAGS